MKLVKVDRIRKIGRIELFLIVGLAAVTGIILYLVLMQQGPAIRCGFC